MSGVPSSVIQPFCFYCSNINYNNDTIIDTYMFRMHKVSSVCKLRANGKKYLSQFFFNFDFIDFMLVLL